MRGENSANFGTPVVLCLRAVRPMPAGTLAIRLHYRSLRLFPGNGRWARYEVRLELFKSDTNCDEIFKA